MLKKILFFVTFLSFVISVSANRDSVTYRKYMGNISFPYNMEVTIKNTSCTGSEETFSGDVSSVFNITGLNGLSCYIRGNIVLCEKGISGGPTGPITGKFKLYASKKEILEKLGVPQKISDNITGNYVQEFSIKMNIIIDSSGRTYVGRATNFNFSDLLDKYLLFGGGGVYEYSDVSECTTCIQESTGTGAVGDSCTGTGVNQVCETNICSYANYPEADESENVCVTNPCLTDGKVGPILSYINFNNCTISGSDSVCYAKSNNDFNLKLLSLGQGYSPVGIKYLKFVANNYTNTSSVGIINNALVDISTISETSKNIGYTYFENTGKYTVEFQGRGVLNDSGTWSNIIDKKLIVIPSNNFKTGAYSVDRNSVYASNDSSESIKYCTKIYDEFGNTINKIYDVTSNVTILNGVKDINNIEAIQISNIKFENSKFCFDINSLVPANKILEFKIKIPQHKQLESLISNGLYSELTIQTPVLEFKQPFSIELIGFENPQIGKDQKYEIKLVNNGNISFMNGSLALNPSSVELVDGHYWTTFNSTKYSGLSSLDNIAKFHGIIDANNNVLVSPKLNTNNLYFQYNIGGKTIKYILDNSNTLEGTTGCNIDTLGVKIIGTLQGDGKGNITGQVDNFSDVYKSKLKSIIRKNAYQLIKNRKSGTVVNGVKYVEGDINISGNLGYETLIVKDGNVIIDGDLNSSNSKLGIIVLKNHYQILNDYDKVGNIYVNNNVKIINAIIYADGVFRSAKANGEEYDDIDLGEQLILNGSLFTKNTIGGATKGNSNFTLPGGQIITDPDAFRIAQKYDLNYIRKVSPECDVTGKQTDNSISFIVQYNPQNQINPPKGFYTK